MLIWNCSDKYFYFEVSWKAKTRTSEGLQRGYPDSIIIKNLDLNYIRVKIMMYMVFLMQKGFCFCTISNPVISFSGSTDHSRGKQNGVSSFGNAGRVRSYWFCVIHSITKTSTPRGVCNKLWDLTALWVSCTWPPFVAGSEWRKPSKFPKIFSMNNEKKWMTSYVSLQTFSMKPLGLIVHESFF